MNNQGGLHLFSLTGGSSMIPGVLALGIVLWLGWKGWRKFRGYERRIKAKALERIREILRGEGESVDSVNSDSNDNNDGDGLRLKPAKKNRRVRFYDNDLHSDAHLTEREIREADDYIQYRLCRRNSPDLSPSIQHLEVLRADSHNITTTEVHVHQPDTQPRELHQHQHVHLHSTDFYNRRPFCPDSDESRHSSPQPTFGYSPSVQSPKSSPTSRDASPDSNFVEEESDRGSSGPEGLSEDERQQYREINQDVIDSPAPSPCTMAQETARQDTDGSGVEDSDGSFFHQPLRRP